MLVVHVLGGVLHELHTGPALGADSHPVPRVQKGGPVIREQNRAAFLSMVERAGPLPTSALASDEPAPIVINIPGAKLLSSRGSGSNGRQHHHARARDVKLQREGTWGQVLLRLGMNGFPFVEGPSAKIASNGMGGRFKARSVTLTRICPKRYHCDSADNLRALFKATLDGVADALGVNDNVFVDNPTEYDIQNGRIGIRYEQIAGPWGVRITIEPAL
jgi:hypothetical protein